MAYTEARKRANEKYLASMRRIAIRMKPEEKERIESVCKAQGMSMQGYIKAAIAEKMERDGVAQ